MAREIKETPVLTGKAARRFNEEVKANENKPVPREEYLRAMKTYKDILKNSNL